MKRAGLLIVSVAGALMLAGCDDVSGVVRDKREVPDTAGLTVRELCLGDNVATCTWHRLRGANAYGWYRRCDVGERYPDCRTLF
jgi:predicted small secreted protein